MTVTHEIWVAHSNRLGNFLTLPSFLGQKYSEAMQSLTLIYCQGVPSYGERLAQILEEDPRIDTDTLALSDPDLFRYMIYSPNVKVIVAVFNEHKNEGLGEHLENFFEAGGGLVGMGFAGWRATTLNASQNVFPLNATSYVSGRYDRKRGTFTQTLFIDQEHVISEEIGNFTANTQKIIMAADRRTGALIPPRPRGEFTVLYKEPTKNAPVVAVYEDAGLSVTFGAFSGDDVEGVPTHYSLFTEQEEFRTLFTNSVLWVWENERRYEAMSAAALNRFRTESADRETVVEDAARDQRMSKNLGLLRSILVVVLMIIGVGVVYRTCFAGRDGSS